MKLEKVENRETKIRIEQYILAREIRETTRKGAEKLKLGKVEIWETVGGSSSLTSSLRPQTPDPSPLTSDLLPRCCLCFAKGEN